MVRRARKKIWGRIRIRITLNEKGWDDEGEAYQDGWVSLIHHVVAEAGQGG